MRSKIRVLSDHTINQIAAGEVIENPASVVKELVENSLDAGADDICVEITGGGRQLIRISDNGCGMNPDDALLCLERHATSKIRAVDDILAVGTMGFRGEAIPSIASISKFLLMTREATTTDDTEGTMVVVDGGKMVSCIPTVHAPGTTIEVKSLFFNVPVRKKFLKSPAVDTNEILKMLSLLALGNPLVKFQLISDGKRLLFAPRSDSQKPFIDQIQERLSAVLGQDFTQNTLPMESKHEAVSVCGVIGLPNYTRHNRMGQYVFINRRGVTSPLIGFAVKDAYGTALPTGRHPVFALYLNIPGPLVDVNVHPQKREVRLRQEQSLRDVIIKAIHKTLRPAANHPSTSFEPHSHFSQTHLPETSSAPTFSFQRPVPLAPTETTWIFQPKAELTTTFTPSLPLENLPSESPKLPSTPTQVTEISLPLTSKSTPPKVIATIPRYILIDAQTATPLLPYLSSNSTAQGLLLIDQKAAHARVLFEKLLNQNAQQHDAQQALLIPYTIDLPPIEADLLQQALPDLNAMGIQIREFGSHSFVVDAIPQIFGNSDINALIQDIVHTLRDTHCETTLKKEKEKLIALAASRAAVSNHIRMTVEEAQALINHLATCQQPHLCPTGKPTLRIFSPEELAKQFMKG